MDQHVNMSAAITTQMKTRCRSVRVVEVRTHKRALAPTAVPLSIPPSPLTDCHDPRNIAWSRPARDVVVILTIIIDIGASVADASAAAAEILAMLALDMVGGRWCEGVV